MKISSCKRKWQYLLTNHWGWQVSHFKGTVSWCRIIEEIIWRCVWSRVYAIVAPLWHCQIRLTISCASKSLHVFFSPLCPYDVPCELTFRSSSTHAAWTFDLWCPCSMLCESLTLSSTCQTICAGSRWDMSPPAIDVILQSLWHRSLDA